jgi:hypothetical protein
MSGKSCLELELELKFFVMISFTLAREVEKSRPALTETYV